jgi:hypothetical protein
MISSMSGSSLMGYTLLKRMIPYLSTMNTARSLKPNIFLKIP